MLKILGFIATAVFIPVVLILLVEWSPRIAHQLLKWIAGRLGDEATAARYLEEWQGDLRDTPNGLSQLFYALSRVFRLPLMARELKVTLTLGSRLRAARRDRSDTAGPFTRVWLVVSRISRITFALALAALASTILTLTEVLSEQVSLIVMLVVLAALLARLVYLRLTLRRLRKRARLRSQIPMEPEKSPPETLMAMKAALEELKARPEVGYIDIRLARMGLNVNFAESDQAIDLMPFLASGHIYWEPDQGDEELIDNTTPSTED